MLEVKVFLLIALIIIAGCSQKAASLDDFKEVPASGDHSPLYQPPVGNSKGMIAPDFVIAIDGKSVSLSNLTAEKPTLLYFWASWCPYCKRDLAAANKVYPEYKDKVNILAIDLDPKESVALISDYKKKGNHDFDFAPADRKVLSDYAITHTTTKVAVDRNRLILWRGSGEVDEATWRVILEGLASS